MDKKRYRVLIAEDERYVLKFMAEALKQKGFVVEEAVDGQEALEKINQAKPDLLVTDGVMPNINGFELCRILRAGEATKDIPILFCSAADPDDLLEKGVRADCFVSKPLDMGEFCRAVNRLLGL